MKRFVILLFTGMLCISCNGQKNEIAKAETQQTEKKITEQPKGTWKVDKKFDENGNLVQYDSIYSWSSSNDFKDLTSADKDSLIQSFKSRFFSSYSGFKDEGFYDIFAQDSLFSNRFFNDDFFGSDFGKDFMDIDKLRERMMERQKAFLEKYQSEFAQAEDES